MIYIFKLSTLKEYEVLNSRQVYEMFFKISTKDDLIYRNSES